MTISSERFKYQLIGYAISLATLIALVVAYFRGAGAEKKV
jgi:hypothetical protein